MKIGIYGDSYTTSNSGIHSPTAWFNILARLLEDDVAMQPSKKWFAFSKKPELVEINHFGIGGSSLYFSYKNFLNTCNQHDLNIFLVTGSNRYFKPVYLTPNKFQYMITCVGQIHHLLENTKLLESDKKTLNDLIGWFESSDDEHNDDIADLMLARIESSHRTTIMYPCFPKTYITEQRDKRHGLDSARHFMHGMWLRQLELLNINADNFTALETHNLSGHLGPEFNEYFAKVLFKRIETGKWDHSGFFDVEMQHPREFYYNNKFD